MLPLERDLVGNVVFTRQWGGWERQGGPGRHDKLRACAPACAFAAGFVLLRPFGDNPGGHRRCGPNGTFRHVGGSRDNLTAGFDRAGHNFRPDGHRVGHGVVTAVPRFAFSVRRILPLRSDVFAGALFARCARPL